MQSSYAKAPRQVYRSTRQSVKSDLSSIKTFCGAYLIYFALCICLSMCLNFLLTDYGVLPKLNHLAVEVLHPVTLALILTSISGTIVLMQSPIIRPVKFDFPVIKAYRKR